MTTDDEVQSLAALRASMEARSAARQSYVSDPDATPASIAASVGVPVETVEDWAQAGGWDALRREALASQAAVQLNMPSVVVQQQVLTSQVRRIKATSAMVAFNEFLQRDVARIKALEFAVSKRVESLAARTAEYQRESEQAKATGAPPPSHEKLPSGNELEQVTRVCRDLTKWASENASLLNGLEHLRELLGQSGIDLPPDD